MENTATWKDEIWAERVAQGTSSIKRVIVLAGFILALNLGATAWMYFEGTNSLGLISNSGRTASGSKDSNTNTRLLTEFDFWTLRLVTWTSAGGAGFLLIMVLGMKKGQSTWKR